VLGAVGPRADEAHASARQFLANAARAVIDLAAFKDGFFPYQGDEIKTWFEALRKRTSPDVILCHWRDTHVSCLLNRILPRTAVISAVLSYRNCLVGLRAIRSAHDSSTGLPQTIECPDATSGTSSWKFDARRWSRGGPRAITKQGVSCCLRCPFGSARGPSVAPLAGCLQQRTRRMAHDTRHSPRLSIGLPVYNGERYLAEAFDCFLAQSFQDFEIIICDNASTDRTAEICRSYAQRDPRIRYYRNEKNLGAIPNFNRVFELSRSRFFKWAAHDDLYHPRYIETCIRILDENPDVILAHSKTAFVDDRGAPFPVDPATGNCIDPRTGVPETPDSPMIADSPVAILRFWQVLRYAIWGTHMFGIVRREMLQKTRLVANFSGGDRPMLAELALLGRFRCSNDVLYSKRFHGNASSALNQKELLGWLSTDDKAYSRRVRQLKTFFTTPQRKPVTLITKAGCVGLVAAHSVRTAAQALAGKEACRAAHGLAWRNNDSVRT
jgi:glycosyltransferase involved in cell wall biosynthesis